MEDNMCYNIKKMFSSEKEGGRGMVCEAVEEYAKRKAEEAAIKTTIEEAETLYNTYTKSIA